MSLDGYVSYQLIHYLWKDSGPLPEGWVEALFVWDQNGDALIVEPLKDGGMRCAVENETKQVEVYVPAGTYCSLCGKEIK